jgi:23S rRNA pseudouridine1911/1915/1917 synthase
MRVFKINAMDEIIVEFITDQFTNDRLDKVLVPLLPQLSRVRIQSLIKKGLITVSGNVETKASFLIGGHVHIKVVLPAAEPTDILPEEIPLDIIFENKNMLVINKPAGMVSHPSAGHQTGTLVNAVLGYAPDIQGIGGQVRPGIVHRLDKDTSGIILVAKDEQTHRWLQDQFRLRKVKKKYLALVDGHPSTDSGKIEASIGRDPSFRKKMSIVSENKGKEAISDYRVIEKFKDHSLLEFHPLTGRTHQIRLHCKLIGCPIVGDKVYGRKNPSLEIKRHFLHAWKLSIKLPNLETKEFIAELPEELEGILRKIRTVE